MKIEASDIAELRPVIDAAVESALAQIAARGLATSRLGYTEPEAADLLSTQPAKLAFARREGRIKAVRIGKRWHYSHESLVTFLKGTTAGTGEVDKPKRKRKP